MFHGFKMIGFEGFFKIEVTNTTILITFCERNNVKRKTFQ